jgi:hypothetical protein
MPGSLTHSLVNSNQLRAFGTTIQDNPFTGTGSLILEDPDEIVKIPLTFLTGTNVGFTTRIPSQDVLDVCKHLHLINRSG